MGINDRKESDTIKIDKYLSEINHLSTNNKKTLFWIPIPEFDNLDPQTHLNIKAVNEVATLQIGSSNTTRPLNRSDTHIKRGDKHKIHYTPQTAEAILSSLKRIPRLNILNGRKQHKYSYASST